MTENMSSATLKTRNWYPPWLYCRKIHKSYILPDVTGFYQFFPDDPQLEVAKMVKWLKIWAQRLKIPENDTHHDYIIEKNLRVTSYRILPVFIGFLPDFYRLFTGLGMFDENDIIKKCLIYNIIESFQKISWKRQNPAKNTLFSGKKQFFFPANSGFDFFYM